MNSSPTQNCVLLPLHDQEVDDWTGNHSGNTEPPKPSFNLLNKGSAVQLCLTLWLPGLQHARPPCPSPLPEFTQAHVHWVSDSIQPSHPLLSPSTPTFNLSQHQDLFKGVSSMHQVAKVLEFQLQPQSFQWIFKTEFFRVDWLDLLAVREILKSLTPQKQQFFGTQLFYCPIITSIQDYWKIHSFD